MRGALELEIALQRFLGVLADQELVEILQVGQAFEEEDALDQPVGVLHLVDRFLLLVLAQLLQAPVVEHPGVQEVLVDRGQLVDEDLVEVLDDFLVAFHARLLPRMRRAGA